MKNENRKSSSISVVRLKILCVAVCSFWVVFRNCVILLLYKIISKMISNKIPASETILEHGKSNQKASSFCVNTYIV
jgi:hypothetical protein